MIAASSRAACPLEVVLVDEELTVCHYCDTRTVPARSRPERHDICPHCAQRYLIEDYAEDGEDDTDTE